MLSVFKLVSCKPEASRELALRPPRPEKLEIFSKFVFNSYNVISPREPCNLFPRA